MSDVLKDYRGKITERTLRLIEARAADEGVGVKDVIGHVLEAWADREFLGAEILQQVLAEHRAGVATERKPKAEKAIENAILKDLRAAGFTVKAQLNTPAGIADLVVYGTDCNALAVIEVKARVITPAPLHQACGQAAAYAEAVRARFAIAAAPGVSRGRQCGVEVMTPDEVVAFLVHELEVRA